MMLLMDEFLVLAVVATHLSALGYLARQLFRIDPLDEGMNRD